MSKWITNWPKGERWSVCEPSLAAQIVAEARYRVCLVDDQQRVSRLILRTPAWAQTLAQRAPAVALARRLSPLDAYRERKAAA